MTLFKTSVLVSLVLVSATLAVSTVHAKEKNGVFFVEPKRGANVHSPLKVKFGVRGMTVKPAGALEKGTGHHHLLIDAERSLPAGTIVPADEKHLHFGKGQTETEVSLAPGTHSLTLQFADGTHASYGPAWAKTITVFVK